MPDVRINNKHNTRSYDQLLRNLPLIFKKAFVSDIKDSFLPSKKF